MLIVEVLLLSMLFAPPPASSVIQNQGSLDEANKLRESGNLNESRDAFERTLKANPDNATAQDGEVQVSERLALNARGAGHIDESLADLLRAQRFAPENVRLLFDLGVLEDEMQLYFDADKTLVHLERLTPKDPKVLYAVARVKLDLGQLSTAEEKMTAYLKVHPDDASAHFGLGRIYKQGLHLENARAEFERSIELQPHQTEAYFQLGDIEVEQKEYKDAVTNFSKTLLGNPKHGGALAGTGIAYYRQKQYDNAVKFLEEATHAAPEYQPGHYYLGLTLARLGKAEESRRELTIATNLAEKNNEKEANRLRLITPDPIP
ncbi:MAG TPA: tetratricopeptide repeat protein [Edaphobacter sp.]|nr:tetratricopeptide repeat protein [Edaphobacter sp.]